MSMFSDLLNTGLSFSVRRDYPLLANAFLYFGADVSATDAEENTYLHLCSSVNMAEVLIKYNANVNAVNSAGEMPLHKAIYRKLFSLSKFLIENEADINRTIPTTGDTALHLAIAGISQESDITQPLVNLLMTLDNAHANSFKTNFAHKTPRDLLVEYATNHLNSFTQMPRDRTLSILVRTIFGLNNYDDFLRLCYEKRNPQQPNIPHSINETFHNCRDLVTAEHLKAAGKDINAYDPVTGYTPLIALMRSPLPYETKIQLISKFIRFGADVNKAELNTLKTPLHIAEDSHVVQTLLAYGAQPNKTDREGNTALHAALCVPGTFKPKDHLIVQRLIANGAALDLPNAAGKTPVDLLIDYAQSAIRIDRILELVADALFGINGLEILNDKIIQQQQYRPTLLQEGPPMITGLGIHQTGTSTSFDFRPRASAIGENGNSNSSEYRYNHS